jgi:hypothetical protein
MNLMYLAAGVLLLILGRKLFWLFVAIIGFLLSARFAPQLLPGQTESVILTVSLIAGLLGALLAILLQKFAVGLAGLVAGGYITYYLLQLSVLNVGQYQWLVILAGALVGAVLAGSMFDWALILITSACGAVLISEGIGLGTSVNYLILIVVFIVGILVQGSIKAKG